MMNASVLNPVSAAPKSALQMFMASQVTATVAAPKSGKLVVAKMADEEVRKWAPFLIDGVLNPETGSPWSWVDPDGVAHVGMMRTVKESDAADVKRRFGDVGSVYVVYPLVTTAAELAKFVLGEYGGGNRKQQKATLDDYVEHQKSGEWSYVGNSAIFTTTAAGVVIDDDKLGGAALMQFLRLAKDSQHNAGHTMTGQLETGVTILLDYKFGVPKKFVGRIDNNRKRDQKSTVEMLKPFLSRQGQVGQVEGYATSTVLGVTNINQMTTIFTTALGIICKVRQGEQPKTGGKQMDNESTAEEAIKYQSVLERATEDVYLLFGKDKTFALHHLVAAMVLACCTENEVGEVEWHPEIAQEIINRYAEAVNPALTDLNMPMVALRTKFQDWSKLKQNTNGSGMNVRWNCLKMALLTAQAGKTIPLAVFDGVKATDHNKHELRLGGIDDYVSAVDAAMANKPAETTGSNPAPLFGNGQQEEKIDA